MLLIGRSEDRRFKATFTVSGGDLGGGLIEPPILQQLTSKACKNIK